MRPAPRPHGTAAARAPVRCGVRDDVRLGVHERRADADRPAAGHSGPQDPVAGRGRSRRRQSLALVTGVGGLLTAVRRPVFGRLSDRTPRAYGMRRPWMFGGLAWRGASASPWSPWRRTSPWCWAAGAWRSWPSTRCRQPWSPCCPTRCRSRNAARSPGCWGSPCRSLRCSARSWSSSSRAARWRCSWPPARSAAVLVLTFAARLDDRRLDRDDARPWSLRDLVAAFRVHPRRDPDFAWAFVGRFLFICAYAFLTTYQAFYLLERVGSAEAEVPRQVFLATSVQSAVLVVASLSGGRLSDRTGRRKAFVAAAAMTYGVALFVIAAADTLQRLPGRHGHQRAGLRHLPGRRPGARR